MSASGGKADVKSSEIHENEGPLSAKSGRSDSSKKGGKCSDLLAGRLLNNELHCEKGHQGRGQEYEYDHPAPCYQIC